MAKIAVVSDIHLGTRQYGLKERYEDFLSAFINVGRSIAEQKVDAVIIGGDLFDSPRPDARSVFVAQTVVAEIKSHGIKVFGIDGNHDLSDEWWLRVIGVECLVPQEATVVGDVEVCGISYKSGRDLVAEIANMADAGMKADVLVAHFALAEMNGGGSADTGVRELSPLLDKMGVKAVLMGHVHIPDCRKWNGVLYVNPGSTEMKSVNEPQEKYFYVLDTDTWTAEPMPIKTRRMEAVEITDEQALMEFQGVLQKEAADVLDGKVVDRPFYHIMADDAIDDAFKRLSQLVHDTGAVARIIMQSTKTRDLAPVVDRKESVATLESAIEARFPKESAEARLTATMLHSPEPSAIHLVVERYMKDE